MKPNSGLKHIFFNVTGIIIAHFTFFIIPAIIYYEVTKLKNVLKKLLMFYFIFYLIGRTSSQFNFDLVSFQDSLGNISTSSIAPPYQGEIFEYYESILVL